MTAPVEGVGSASLAGDAEDHRCVACGGRLEVAWQACGWCGRPVDGDGRVDADASVAVADPAAVAGPGASGATSPETAALPIGTMLLARYRIDAVLGRGGFGITYRARDTRLRRDVAVKELFPPPALRRGEAVVVSATDRSAFQHARERFQREAAALARFNHPGIVRIFEVFEANDTAYLVMELIEGSSVGELLVARGVPFGVTEVLDMVLRVGGALGAVHAAGLLHRDVNPSNLMVDGAQRVVLIDFGLARRYGEDISGSVTRAVTPGYAPPEQYAGSARSGPSCDVFGLAATAYKLLTGSTPTNVFDRQAGTALPAPASLRPDIPPMVSAAILDGMELDPDHRPATAEAFLHRLGLHGATPARRVLLATGTGTDDVTFPGVPLPLSPVDTPRPGPVADPVPAAPVVGAPVAAPRAGAGPVVVTPPPVAPVGHVAGPQPGVVPAQPAGAGHRPFAPWHDDPPIVGPRSRRRGWVTWPAGVAVVALASAAPLVVAVIVGLVVLPASATAGDWEVHRYRRRIGAQRRRWHDAGWGVVVPVRFVRNLVVAAARALPAVAVGAVGYAVERVLADGATGTLVRDLAIRGTGVAMALVLLVPARHGGRGFRTDLGFTTWAEWAMEGRERPGIRVFVVWVLAVAAVAFGAWLRPDLWPLV